VTPEHFDALFDTFHTTVARLETLPAYAVADYEGDRLAAFLAGQPLPERTIVNDPWLARIATTTLARKTWMRVRVLDEPLTDYERFELAVFPESQVVGEQIRVVPRSRLTVSGGDFWLFDRGTRAARVVLMRYDEFGHWLGADLSDDPGVVGECHDRFQAALAASVALNQFLAVPHG